ncbi:hypothetical protein V3H18_13420 [Methylocystis sp. 9N]|uniref:Uncharacterized protein n=1 Tax=Methylocystis borbori TaxID=3118750 RepID=A0ABU7XJI1_9HYPH
MKLAQSQRRALCAFAGLAAIQAAPALAADDKSTMTSVMELVGVSSDEGVGKIDYSERPKLVLPPSQGVLPAPRERSERPGGWPNELVSERRRNADRYARVPNAPTEEKKSLLERVRGPRPAAAPGTDDEPGLLQRMLSARKGTNESAVEEPNRRLLTEPPPGYRRPTQDLSKIRESNASSKSWWNPMSWVGGAGSDSDPVAQTATPNSPVAKPEGQGGGLSSLLPRFILKDSDKD